MNRCAFALRRHARLSCPGRHSCFRNLTRTFSTTEEEASKLPLLSYVHGAPLNLEAGSDQTFDVINPGTGEFVAKAQEALGNEVDAAVQSGERGLREWARFTADDRAKVLLKAAALLREREEEIAYIECMDTGRPISETKSVDVASAYECLEYMAGLTRFALGNNIPLQNDNFALTSREPLGVCSGIGAWNYPIQGAVWKSAPALAFGNTMTFKPSPETPLSALILADVYTEAGVPAGGFNVVLGGQTTGELLITHPKVAKVSFTGSVATGLKVNELAARSLKKVTMELGGKSPLIIFEDADIESAVSATILANFYSCGEICSNAARVYVHESIKPQFTEALLARTQAIRTGDPMDPGTQMGALINKAHYEKVMRYIESGTAQGAQLICGGGRPELPAQLQGGFYVEPTIFDNCNDQMTIVKEEVFGPVLALLSFDDERDVVKRCNDTQFGLAAGLFTRDLHRARRVSRQLDAGTVWVNDYNTTPVEAPWGGFKQSGLGNENGPHAYENWTREKAVHFNFDKVPDPFQ